MRARRALAAFDALVPFTLVLLVLLFGDEAPSDNRDGASRGLVVAESVGSAAAPWTEIATRRMVAHARDGLGLGDEKPRRVAILDGDSPTMRRHSEAAGPSAVLELAPGVLFDMHFTERGRLAQLATMFTHLVAADDTLRAIAMDNRTARLANGRSSRAEVIGDGSATVLFADATSATSDGVSQ